MEGLLKEWITGLAVIAILGVLVDLLLPSGAFRKYTGFIFGLVLLVFVLQPLLNLLGGFNQFEDRLAGNFFQSDMHMAKVHALALTEVADQQLVEAFQRRLESQIAQQVKRWAESSEVSVAVSFALMDGKPDLTRIDRVILSLSKGPGMRVEPIEIAVDAGSKKENGTQIKAVYTAEERRLRDLLASFLEIPPDKIEIKSTGG